MMVLVACGWLEVELEDREERSDGGWDVTGVLRLGLRAFGMSRGYMRYDLVFFKQRGQSG